MFAFAIYGVFMSVVIMLTGILTSNATEGIGFGSIVLLIGIGLQEFFKRK
jgi:hypothetical protein